MLVGTDTCTGYTYTGGRQAWHSYPLRANIGAFNILRKQANGRMLSTADLYTSICVEPFFLNLQFLANLPTKHPSSIPSIHTESHTKVFFIPPLAASSTFTPAHRYHTSKDQCEKSFPRILPASATTPYIHQSRLSHKARYSLFPHFPL